MWGEAGHVFARKMFNAGLSNAPQDLTPADFGGRAATTSEAPDIDAEDDSSYAWAVFRQNFADGGSRVLARRQRGTQFDPPVAVDAGDESVRDPRVDLNGRGQGLATTAGVSTGQPLAALIDKRDVFGPAGGSSARARRPGGRARDLREQQLVVGGGAGRGRPAVRAVRPFDDGRPGRDCTLSRPEFGPVVPELGFDAASDRAGGVVVGVGAGRRGRPAHRRRLLRPAAGDVPRLHQPALLSQAAARADAGRRRSTCGGRCATSARDGNVVVAQTDRRGVRR